MERAQVEDELREILDAVDVVVHGRRDERRARLRVTQPRDVRHDFHRRQLPAFARLRALRDLDLQFVGGPQIRRRDAEARGCDLLRPAAVPVAVRGAHVAVRLLAAFAAVAARPDPVHRARDHAMRFGRQRADRHRGGEEPPADRFSRFHALERDRRGRRELEQIPDCGRRTAVDVRLERRVL